MKLWTITYKEPSPVQKPLIFLNEGDAKKVYDRIRTEMTHECAIFSELDTEDDFQSYILSGGNNWYVSYESDLDYYNAELCLVEERPLTGFEGTWSMTVRASTADEAVRVLKKRLKEQRAISGSIE